MKIKLQEIAKLVNGKITGEGNFTISGLAKIDEAENGELTFLYHPAYEKYFQSTKASAILVKTGFDKTRSDIIYVEVDYPEKAFFTLIRNYFTPAFPLEGIDKSAFVHPDAAIGKGTALGKNVVVSSGCKIGDNVKIFHNTVLLDNVEVGDGSLIFHNVSIRENCKIGKRAVIHPGTVIGADGFGFNPDEKGVYHKIPQVGNVIIEDDVELGANVTVDRASLGSTIIKTGVKIDNLVQIAHNVVIGENTVISSQSGISGSTKIGKNCILAGQVGLVGHIEIADNTILLAQAGISKSIKKAGKYFGSPAKELSTALRLEAHLRSLPEYAERIRDLENQIKTLQEEIQKANK
jgi:UDP-3-O-[3-hydroxymyristoyl] glucosamine N-acyltransferase